MFIVKDMDKMDWLRGFDRVHIKTKSFLYLE